MKKLIFFIILLILSLASQVSGAYYYASTSGADTNVGSAASPWLHIPGMAGCSGNCASHSVQASDVFVLYGGDTWSNTQFGSTTADLITIGVSGITIMGGQHCGYSPATPFQPCDGSTAICGSAASLSCNVGVAWGSGWPTIDGTGATDTRSGIIGLNKSALIDGIKLYNIGNVSTGGGGFGVLLDGGGGTIEVKNCFLETYAVESIAVGMSYGNVNHLWIHDNFFRNNGRSSLGQGSGDTSYVIDDVQLYNNYFQGISASSLEFGSAETNESCANLYVLNKWACCPSSCGGTGYAVNDVITVLQAGSDNAATFKIKSVDGNGTVHGDSGAQSTPITTGTGYTDFSNTGYDLSVTCSRGGGACTGASGLKAMMSSFHTVGWMIQANSKQDFGVKNLKIHNNKFYGDWRYGATALMFFSGCVAWGDNSRCVDSGNPGPCCTAPGVGTCTDFANAACTGNQTPYKCCTGSLTGTCKQSCVLAVDAGDGPYSTQHIQIYDNIVSFENNTWVPVGSYMITALVDFGIGWHDDVQIWNNTISSSPLTEGNSPVANCIAAVTPITTRFVAKNNIIDGCTNGISFAGGSATNQVEGVVLDYNLYSGIYRMIANVPGTVSSDCRYADGTAACYSGYGFEQHGIAGAPHFTSPPSGGVVGSGNWTILTNSDAKYAGVASGQLSAYSFPWNAWHSPPSIGAYEFGDSGGGGTTYTITTSAGTHCSSLSCSPNPVDSGSTSTCTNTPAGGYSTSGMSGCGGSWSSGNTMVTAAMSADCTVSSTCAVSGATVGNISGGKISGGSLQ